MGQLNRGLPETGFKHSKCLLHNNPSSPVTPIVPFFSSGLGWATGVNSQDLRGYPESPIIQPSTAPFSNLAPSEQLAQTKASWVDPGQLPTMFRNLFEG